MDLGLKGKRAVVFGASMGLGRAIAEALAVEGAAIAIAARKPEPLEGAARALRALGPAPVFARTCDLSKPGEALGFMSAVNAEWGSIDILVTNTGGPPKGTFETITSGQWKEGFQGLWLSAIEAMQVALPGMKEHGYGRILLVTSVAAKEPMGGLTVSNGLRAGLLGLMKSLSHEVASYGVTVNALLPGYTRTERLKELGIDEKRIAQIPAGRLGEPHELGALAAFLASPRAAYITGQAIAIDGGYLKGF